MTLISNSDLQFELKKRYITGSESDKKKAVKNIISSILTKRIPSCNFIEWKEYKIVYQR